MFGWSKKRKRPAWLDQAATSIDTYISGTFFHSEQIGWSTVFWDAEFPPYKKWNRFLKAVKSYRDAGKIDQDEAFFYIAFILMGKASEIVRSDTKLARIIAKIKKKEKEDYELSRDEFWPTGQAPADIEALRAEHYARYKKINAKVMLDNDEAAMAGLYLENEKEFFRKRVRGAFLLVRDDEKKCEKDKDYFRDIIIEMGWSDLLRVFGMAPE